MRLVYMGSPACAIGPLAYLLETQAKAPYKVVAVVSQAAKPFGRGHKQLMLDPPLAQFAKERQLLTLQPERAQDADFLASLAALEPDVVITCAYGQILTSQFLAIPRRATINIHPSRLPQYRGATPVQAALLAGDSTTAVSVLFTVKALDAGAMIVQKDFAIAAEEKADELLERLFIAAGPLLAQALACLENPAFIGRPQDETKASHCRKIVKESGLIDWQEDRQTIFNRFRAYHPWPGTYTFFHGKRVLIEAMTLRGPELAFRGGEGGELGSWHYSKEARAIGVRAQDGWVYLQRLKPEGSKPLDAQNFWNGHGPKKA